MAKLIDMVDYVNRTLDSNRIEDYCPNGLQIEGRAEVRRLVSGVTACQRLIDAAVDDGADALLVHHGCFWRGDSLPLTGIKGRRVKRLVRADISLLAWHLPLDVHAELGNNAEIGRRLDIRVEGCEAAGGCEDLLWYGRLDPPLDAETLLARVTNVFGRPPMAVAGLSAAPARLQRIAWCSGGGQGFIEQAAALGADVYLSGEISEQTTHLARENALAYLAVGHHASERFGVQALAAHVAKRFDIEHRFIDVKNPA